MLNKTSKQTKLTGCLNQTMTGGHQLVAKNKDSFLTQKMMMQYMVILKKHHSVAMSYFSVYRFMMIYVGRYLAVFSGFGKFVYAHL